MFIVYVFTYLHMYVSMYYKIIVFPKILAVIKFGNLPEILPNALLAEIKFDSLPESYVIA